MSKYIWRFFLVVSFCLGLVLSKQQHFVCKNIEDVFVERESSAVKPHQSVHQGPPGKIGPRGFPGLRGLPGNAGPSASVDYNVINDAIDGKVANSLAKITTAIDKIRRNLSVLVSESDCKRQGGLVDAGKCFTIPQFSSRKDVHFQQHAVRECARTGASLAEIHDQSEQNNVYDFALGKMPAGLIYAELRLRMEYNPSTSTMLYSSGTKMDKSQLHWHPGYPTSNLQHESVFLAVRRSGSNFGVFIYTPSHAANGVVCEKEI